MTLPIPIVDSHVHLWTETQLETLAWHSPTNPLGAQHSVDDYLYSADEFVGSTPPQAQSQPQLQLLQQKRKKYLLRGFVYLEVDRISSTHDDTTTTTRQDLDSDSHAGWTHVLDEVAFLARIAAGLPRQGEGHVDEHRHLLLGFVPWAPVPGGPSVLEEYISRVKESIGRAVITGLPASARTEAEAEAETDHVWTKLRGVRYLVQDKPAETMLQSDFVEGLKWLGRQRLTFDLGVDARQGGLSQLREAVELLRRVYDGVEERERVVVIINHLCKPNLYIPTENHADFLEWKSLVTAMASLSSTTYMKLSGLFSEFPLLPQHHRESTQDTNEDDVIDYIVNHVRPWTDVLFDAFGAHRIMFGSDWPVCTVGNGAATSSTDVKKRKQRAWSRWATVVERILDRRRLSEDEKRDVWGGVAIRAYGMD